MSPDDVEPVEKRRDWRLVIATAFAALVPSVIGWIGVQTEEAKIEDISENYYEYIIDNLKRDEALERALLHCLAERYGHDGKPPTLEEVAERYGYEP